MLADTSESIKPQTLGGATAGHMIIYQSLHVQCPHTVALTRTLAYKHSLWLVLTFMHQEKRPSPVYFTKNLYISKIIMFCGLYVQHTHAAL